MPSPFPGMNPYLERDTVWSDFHGGLCYAIRRALVPQLQPEFYVKVGEHLYVHAPEDDNRRLVGHADVSVTKGVPSTPDLGGVALLEAPVRAQISEVVDEERVPYLEIYDKKYHTLVTAIELLSPANKYKGQRLIKGQINSTED